VRHYVRLGTSGLLATRLRAYKSTGDSPGFIYFGGNSEMRGYDYLEFVGQNVVFGNAEIRFPLIEAALTPIGVVGGVRGVFFANIGAGWFQNQGFKFAESSDQIFATLKGYNPLTGDPIQGTPITVSGFRLQDARASYGIGLETFILGFPLHFDWAWRTLFNTSWEDVLFNCSTVSDDGACGGGSSTFRKSRFAVWIGYDF
jgi:outer membrane protein assembly factor BamA